jgi:hypothetical protein
VNPEPYDFGGSSGWNAPTKSSDIETKTLPLNLAFAVYAASIV